MVQPFVTNTYYPLNYDNDEVVSWVRKFVCIIFCTEIIFIVILRICSIFTPLKIHHHHQDNHGQKVQNTQTKTGNLSAKKQEIFTPLQQMPSTMNLKEKQEPPKKDNKKQGILSKSKSKTKFSKKNDKAKVVTFSNKKLKKQGHQQNQTNKKQNKKNDLNNKQNKQDDANKQKSNKKPIKIPKQQNKNKTIQNTNENVEGEKRKSILKQSGISGTGNQIQGQQRVIAFNLQQITQYPFDSSNQSDSSSSSQSSQQSQKITEQQLHLQRKQHRKDIKHYIRIKHLNKSFQQFSTIMNLLFSHFLIAFSTAMLYFPYAYIAILAGTHLILILLLIVLHIFISKQKSVNKYLTKIMCGIIYLINLAVIVLAIFGICKSNKQYYTVNQIIPIPEN